MNSTRIVIKCNGKVVGTVCSILVKKEHGLKRLQCGVLDGYQALITNMPPEIIISCNSIRFSSISNGIDFISKYNEELFDIEIYQNNGDSILCNNCKLFRSEGLAAYMEAAEVMHCDFYCESVSNTSIIGMIVRANDISIL